MNDRWDMIPDEAWIAFWIFVALGVCVGLVGWDAVVHAFMTSSD